MITRDPTPWRFPTLFIEGENAAVAGASYIARRVDPEGAELAAIRRFLDLEGALVLDVGCGEGRLTAKLGVLASHAFGVDPVATDVAQGWREVSPERRVRTSLAVGAGEHLPVRDAALDVVFFTWSLCCMASTANMKAALHEAWRVLKPSGHLVNLQPSLYQPFTRGYVTYLITGVSDDLVMDEGSALPREARFALQYTSLLEGKFDLLGEAEFEVRSYYDTEEELLERLVQGREAAYERLDDETKALIHKRLRSMRTPNGVLRKENAVLTALRRSA